MSHTTAADRLDDSFPHGTPEGYRLGCRGNGGCPNRDTTRMTCKEADLRYHVDFRYRHAYDAGDIWLDREQPRSETADRVRSARGGFVRGERRAFSPAMAETTAADAQLSVARPTSSRDTLPPEPEPEPEPEVEVEVEVAATESDPSTEDAPAEQPDGSAAVPQRWRHGTVAGYDRHGCRCDACSEAKRLKNEGARGRRRARIAAGDELPSAQAALEQARAEAADLRRRLDETLAALVEAEAAARRPVIEVTQDADGTLRVRFAIAPDTMQLLANLVTQP